MQRERHYYLISVQFLGFRYSGWQKQPHQKTVEGMLLKTLKFILPKTPVKILGAGRTDAKVSALETAFELFIDDTAIQDIPLFIEEFNKNVPPDIRILDCKRITSSFNIIKDAKIKEYVYLFSFGEKNHPFCAPLMTNILDNLDMEEMQKAALLFQGTHDFRAYTAKPKEGKKMIRTIDSCKIIENRMLKANFFPKKSYMLQVQGTGFMRYQIRMIMGALFQLGKGELTMIQLEASLKSNTTIQLSYVAPGSGLILNKVAFK